MLYAALDFAREYRQRRLRADAAHADVMFYAQALAASAVDGFADWCVIRVGDVDIEAGGNEDASNESVRAVVDELLSSATRQPVRLTSDGVHYLAHALEVSHVAPTTVVLVRRHGNAFGNEAADVVADVMVTATLDMERAQLQHESRVAVRQSQRVASQLHQLIAASLTVGSSQSPASIVTNLARSTRSVFDADDALVALSVGPFAPLMASAPRGRAPRLVRDPDGLDLAFSLRDDTWEPWQENGWLVAPVAIGRRQPWGVVATRRDAGHPYGDEDREVLALLAQMTATSLDAVALNHTISDNETRLRVLVDAAPVAIVESGVGGEIRWWNRAASRLLHWPQFSADVVGEPTWPAATGEHLATLWSDLLAGREIGSFELPPVTLEERQRILTASAALLPSGAGPAGLLTLLDDVTDQRALREEVRHAHRMELRGQVASSIAHDFNNLLTLISGYTELLGQDLATNERALGLVHDIQTTTKRASGLTTQLQSIGRTSAPEPVVLELNAALMANAEVLERVLGRAIDLSWVLADSELAIRTDADLFEQMVLNLSINARDAMPDGGRLTVCTEAVTLEADTGTLAPGPYVRLTITDTGVGMDEETQRRCFEPLFTTKGPFKGTGLGLASARRLVEDSGGAISCHSTPGRGTTFEMLFPAIDAPVVASATPPPTVRGGATVLVVDDDVSLRRLMTQVLRRNGFRVLDVESATEALAAHALADEHIDLVVSDVVMPDLQGPDLVAAMQRTDPTLLVLLVSGTAHEDVIDGLVPGTSAFLAKPFKPSSLVDEVHRLLARRPDTH